jgi:hypothetical protein
LSVVELNDERRALTPEQARRRRRRSVALGLVLGALAVLFYVLAIAHGPEIMNRPL